ncbi:folate-binding protein YgfZ [Burkholderia sp. WAC0059]|uniref:CAF17-like 4Fe-4S cluster assembly/insertion protein YgfZ n=1 Tax=Burkholderia sp. WAC0059 TaxID=2066022 RepID=UPI000C7F6382|nr:folate-binding protein YgfZ [Burkholderia sp. WAC0059]PLZ03721.1 folate-binding protein YgfZ [Burkholderia sp. WAC0059]
MNVPLDPASSAASHGPAAHASPASAQPAARPSSADFDAVLNGGACAVLPQFGVIDVQGDDAASFLHGQLTNDVEHLDATLARLAGYCSPKGRLLASLLIWKTGGGTIRLVVAKDVQAAAQKRLSMFVLRAKAKLVDAGDAANEALVVAGFAGDVRDALAGAFDTLPDVEYGKVDGPAGTLVRLTDAAGQPRYLLVGPQAAVEARLAAAGPALARVSPAVWDWLDVRAGVPRITQPVAEQFVPQMVNFDVVGGVNFRKGCYPGQEVVARSQYRGTIKRRMSLASVSAPPEAARPGAELFHSGDPGQPCGMVVNAAAAPDGGIDLLAEIKLAALETGTVHLGAADGPALTFLPLPYALPAEG